MLNQPNQTSSHLMNTYARLPVSFSHGEGAYLFDADGNRYFDALTGLAVCGLGHAHPRVTQALAEQAGRLLHTSNLYEIPRQAELAARLTALSGMDRAFFGNSGAEANEAAIKIARLLGHQREINVPAIIVMDDAFHGRTMGTLTATGSRKVQAGFEPLLAGFVRAPYNDVAAIQTIADNNTEVVAVFLEPILGEAGIVIPDPGYLAALRRICDEHQWLLMLDEVQSGNGRTGRYFAYQHADILPDVVTTAKGLGNGVPIGVCLARGIAADVLQPGNHGSTFGGNPLACAAATAVLDSLEEDNLIDRAAELGNRLLDGFRAALAGDNRVADIRGKGLMLGIELEVSCASLVAKALDEGLLINVTQDRIIRLLPPLILSDAEADDLVARVSELVLNLE
ncbi:MAG: acetylornithine transaminase [Gammaproteobacteria bacterium]|nr:MAG: acetylornithine transaminase [Gammaproteobacteria bacterium]